MKKSILMILPAALAAIFLLACSGGNSGASTSGNNSSSAPTTTAAVELNEWTVKPPTSAIKAGNVYLEAKNTGTRNHELRISRLGGASPQAIGIIESFQPAQTKSKEFALTPGQYELSCQLAEQEGGQVIAHYALGMKVNIIVE